MLVVTILVLIGWLAYLAIRLGELRRQLDRVRFRLTELERSPPPTAAEPAQSRAAAAPSPRTRKAEAKPEREIAEPDFLSPEPVAEQILANELFAAARRAGRARKAKPLPTGKQLADWLSENALAWIGGGVLALGGIFLVGYAAQRGFFAPAMRIGGAIVVGAVLLAVSEWLRRQANREARGNRLAAAAAAGAGAATLYAAAWAALVLYHFIGIPVAGGLMALTSVGLLALALLHGEALALLAVGGGLLAPAITGVGLWAAPALGVYLTVMLAAGYGAMGLRRWGRTGLVTLAGAALWSVAAMAEGGFLRGAALAVAPVALAIAALAWRRRLGETVEGDRPKDSFTLASTLAIGLAALLLAPIWSLYIHGAAQAAVGIGCALLCGLAALAVRRGLAPPAILLAAFAAVAAAATPFALDSHPAAGLELWAAFAALSAAACGLWSAATGPREPERLCAGGGALSALTVALALRGPWHATLPWAAPALAMLALAAGAWLVARRAEQPKTDLALAFWVWCASTGLLAAVAAASPPSALPATLALAAAVFAIAHVRLGWRGWLAAANAAALASLTALVNPELLGPLFAHKTAVWAVAVSAAAAAALTYAASRVVRAREPGTPTADALSTAAVLVVLTGAFVLLRLWASWGAKPAIDPFLESGLRTALLLAGGLLTAQGAHDEDSLIGRWRGQAMLAAGALHGLVAGGLMLNPLWAWWTPAVSGPPLVDSLAVGFLAPALLLAAATRGRVARNRPLLIGYAAAVLAFGSLWGLEEIRRLFQGPTLHGGRDFIGRAEVAAYAVAALAGAASLMWTADRASRRPWTISSIAGLARRLGLVAAAGALAFAVFVFGWAASPWWGPIGRPLDGALDAALLFGFYALGAGLALWLIRAAEGDAPPLSRGVRIGAVAIIFALTNLVVRWGFRGLDMRPNLREASVETWAFSAVWGLFGFALLAFAAARREADLRWAGLAVLLGTTAKIFLFDMGRLDGVVRAASFLAVGGLLLAAAVVTRRLSGGVLGFGRSAKDEA